MGEPLRKVESSTAKDFPGWKVKNEGIGPKARLLLSEEPDYQAYQILRVVFTIAPIIAGLDKFFDLLVDWKQYLAPSIAGVFGIMPNTLMMGAGVVEVLAGIGVALRPRIFGYVVSVWLFGIVGNLLLTGKYFDIALRDVGLSLGAFALARLAGKFKTS